MVWISRRTDKGYRTGIFEVEKREVTTCMYQKYIYVAL